MMTGNETVGLNYNPHNSPLNDWTDDELLKELAAKAPDNTYRDMIAELIRRLESRKS